MNKTREKRAPKRQYEGATLITLPQSCRITGFGLSTSYEKARAGKLPGAVMIDGRWYVHKPKLLAWLDSLGAESAA
jgi:predicted DNA-binding transcriptional regulator AlpA